MSTALDRTINGEGSKHVRPRIKCADGFALSVQASSTHYCLDADGNHPDLAFEAKVRTPYTAVEIGYPAARPEPWRCSAWSEGYDRHNNHPVCDGWERYVETADDPTGTVYGCVPVQMVRDLIALHGGESQ